MMRSDLGRIAVRRISSAGEQIWTGVVGRGAWAAVESARSRRLEETSARGRGKRKTVSRETSCVGAESTGFAPDGVGGRFVVLPEQLLTLLSFPSPAPSRDHERQCDAKLVEQVKRNCECEEGGWTCVRSDECCDDYGDDNRVPPKRSLAYYPQGRS